jgi:hydroxymethylbilane synthase
VAAERAFLGRLNGGCQVPIGAHATLRPTDGAAPEIALVGMVGSPDGAALLREQMSGGDPAALGVALAERLLARGADKLLAEYGGSVE